MPVASRAEHHASGHVTVPEPHRLAHHDVRDPRLRRFCGHGQTEGTRPDDQEPGLRDRHAASLARAAQRAAP